MMGGFSDPETNKKAQEKSLITRRNKRSALVKVFQEDNLSVPTEEQMNNLVEGTGAFKDIQTGFTPTLPQLKILAVALSLEHGDSVRSWFRAAKLNRNDWYFWVRNPDFVTWWRKAWAQGLSQYQSEWVALGIKRMQNAADPKAFDYWRTIGERVFGFIQQIAVKENKSAEEEALTKELLDLVKDINVERKAQIVEGVATEFIEQKESDKSESSTS